MGKQRTGYSSAGVSLMSGSVQDVFADTLQGSANDMVAIKLAASNKATAAAESCGSQATGAIVSTVGNVGSSVLSYSQMKVP